MLPPKNVHVGDEWQGDSLGAHMTRAGWKYAFAGILVVMVFGAGSIAAAQTAAQTTEHPWSVEFGLGWDNDITGDIIAGGIGQINGQNVVMTRSTYEDVYGTGLHLKGGVGYMLHPKTELRVTLAFQSLGAAIVTPLGDIGVSRLYGSFDDYQSVSLDFGVRKYHDVSDNVELYGEGALGIGFIDSIEAVLVAPGANLVGKTADLYDRTAAFVFSVNGGLLYKTSNHIGIFGQLGFRRTTGLSEADNLVGTGLETINDKSGRWSMPIVMGIRYKF
jgi:hypothetical protein